MEERTISLYSYYKNNSYKLFISILTFTKFF